MRFHCFFLFVLCPFILVSQNVPHHELIQNLKNGKSIYIEKGAPYNIDIQRLIINGKNYTNGPYPKDPDFDKIKRKYSDVFNKLVFVLEKENDSSLKIPMNPNRGRFKGTTGHYKLSINVDPNSSVIDLNGTIFILTKENHKNRNKYNKVAKGKLIRVSGNRFKDEDGFEWILQSQLANAYHNPDKNVKFLHKVGDVGEYETIRSILIPCEGEINSFGQVTIKSNIDTLRGCNVIDPRSPENGGTYNFGQTTNIVDLLLGNMHKVFDVDPHNDPDWGDDYRIFDNSYACETDCESVFSTLFLMDASGSMSGLGVSGKAKIEEAKEAVLKSINSLKKDSSSKQEVGILTFSGVCVKDPTAAQPLQFYKDIDKVKGVLNTIRPGGGTPLKEAAAAAKKRLQNYSKSQGSSGKVKFILLSDGVSSCDKIRPPDVYSGRVNLTKKSVTNPSSKQGIRYFTVGFDIKPGSKAERDLQYLANSSGGRYLNTQNPSELQRAFKKFSTTYKPKISLGSIIKKPNKASKFQKGVFSIQKEQYEEALFIFEELTKEYPNEENIIFNLALSYELNDYYPNAIKFYQKYLQTTKNSLDKKQVKKKLKPLNLDYNTYYSYNKEVIKNDINYLEGYFKKIQNGESIALTKEFQGFIKEKQFYYQNLSKLLGIVDRSFLTDTKEVSRQLKTCSLLIRKKPKNWDKNASPFLSVIYLYLEKTLNRFDAVKPKIKVTE